MQAEVLQFRTELKMRGGGFSHGTKPPPSAFLEEAPRISTTQALRDCVLPLLDSHDANRNRRLCGWACLAQRATGWSPRTAPCREHGM